MKGAYLFNCHTSAPEMLGVWFIAKAMDVPDVDLSGCCRSFRRQRPRGLAILWRDDLFHQY